MREWALWKKYGLTDKDIEAMFAAQDGKCPICSDPLGILNEDTGKHIRVCVDHDHVTNKVRGLLCDPCNKGLGTFNDDPVRLRKGAEYIEASRIET